MANVKECLLPLCLASAAFFLSTVHSSPYHNTLDTPSYSPLPRYLAITRDNPNSSPYPPTSSLAPTSPVYTDQRSYPSDRAEYSDDDYDSGALSGIPSTSSPAAPHSREPEPEYSPVPEKNTGFVEPIDFSSLLKNVGSMPNTVALAGGASNSNPLFASESRDTFSGFFGSSKNPFEELSRLNTASSNQNPSGQYGEQENVGFVNPDVQFRSLFDSSGIAGDSKGFEAKDFLGSKGAQTRAYPSYTYSGRGSQNGDDEEEEENDDREDREDSDRQYRHRQGEPERSNSPSESDEEDDDESEPVYYAASPGSKDRRGNERTTQRQAPAESSNSPQTKSKSPEKKSPKCKKIEKQIDYASEDHESFTEPDEDYDPSTYQGRYKRQTRQRGGRGGKAGKRPLTCYVCEDDEGHFAENCSFDSSASPNKDGNNYYHSESSSSYNDNGRRGKANRGGNRQSKRRNRRSPSTSTNHTNLAISISGDNDTSAETIKPLSVNTPQNQSNLGKPEQKVIDKRQTGIDGFGRDDGYNNHAGFGSNYERNYNPIQFPQQYYNNPYHSGSQQTSASNRQDNTDDFDIRYSDYVKSNFPENYNSPVFDSDGGREGAFTGEASDNPSSYDYKPNYYHRPRNTENENQDDFAPEVSHSSSSDNYSRRQPHHYGNRGNDDSSGFSLPRDFFDETSDSNPAVETYGQLNDFMKEFSTKSRGDGCERVNKGDMTCWVCRDPKGMKKEECAYASDDPRNKAMAYHEVAEYSNPIAVVLPKLLHAT